MNMKKQLLQIGFSLFITTAFFACKKDIGNYVYTDANVITITTDMATANPQVVINNDSVIVKQNDSLKLDILITQTIPVSDLSYQWLITQAEPSSGNPAQYIVGTEKQLRTKIILPPNLYRLVVRVTDNKTGVSFYKFYNLNVDTSPWGGEGWLVLQDQPSEGGCDISIITSRDAVLPGTVYSNLYFAANSKKLPVGTYKTAVMNYNNTFRIQKVSFMYPNGASQVRSVDYLDSSDHTTWFWVPPSMINVQENGVFPVTGQWEYLINNSQFQLQQVNAVTIKNPPLKFSAPLLGSWSDLSSSMILGNTEGTFTLFDKTNRCFFTVWVNTASGGGVMTLVPTSRADVPNLHYSPYSGAGGTTNLTATGKGFDMNNIGRNLIYSDNVTPMTGTISYDCIFRNTIGDSTFMYQIPSGFSGANGGYTNNFTSGRFFLSESKVLVVATDETASSGGHKVYFFNLTATGEINNTPAKVYTGFDKIVDITFKKGLGF